MQPKLIIVVITLALVLVPIVGLSAQTSEPVPDFTTSKAIVSQVGEVTQDVRAVGEVIKYKVYFRNNSDQQADIVITDKLDTNLSHVAVFNDGIYDEQNHSVIWKIGDILGGQNVSVEFEAVIGMANLIRNQATIQVDGQRDIQTNVVETTVCGVPELGWIPFDGVSKPGEVPRSAMKDETTMGATVNFDIPGMFVHEVKAEGVIYHRMSIPGHATLTDIGKPELPIIGQIIEVPYGVNFDIEIIKSQSIPLECYNVYPAQEPLRDQEAEALNFSIDEVTYQTDAFYPEELAMIGMGDIGIVRGHRIVFLKVNPLQYNPVTREMRAFSNIEVRLNYDKPAQTQPVSTRIMSPAFEALLQRVALNYMDSSRFDVDNEPEKREGCDYLVLTHGDFYDPSDSNNPIVQFQNWKQQKGYQTKVVDIADIPEGQTADDIRAYLQTAYNTWYPPPTYVLLVGDAEFIPTNYETQHPFGDYNNAEIGTDLYYATLDGTDYFPDLFIGRLPVDTLVQTTDIVNKMLAYEQNPPGNANFYTDTTLIALFEDDTDGPGDMFPEDGREDRPWIENIEEIREYLEANGYNPERIYATSSGFPGDPFSDDPEEYQNGTDLPDDLTVAGNPAAGIPGFAWNGGTVDVNNAIVNGSFLVTYRDHGSRNAWSGFIGFDLWDATGLANGDLTPVVLSIACENGWFDNESDDDVALAALATGNNDECLGEHFVRNANGGAIAFIGATRVSWTGWNDFFMFGLHMAIWPDFTPNPPITGYPALPGREMGPLVRMGQVHTFGKVYMANAYNHDVIRQATFEMYHLFGDPEMPIWTEEPSDFDVDHPEGIGSTGEQDFIVKVTDVNTGDPVQSAVVVLTRGGTILGTKQTNPGGIVRFTLTTPGNGDLDITVTALNYRPYQGIIEINNGGADLNRLEPEDGIQGHTIHVGGQDFSGDEKVDVHFDNQLVATANSTAGKFGQSGVEDVDIQVPTPYNLGLVNILAHGQTSDRYAVDVFQVRTANPIDLYTYSQRDDTTWHLQPGGVLTWNNPEIQLYDSNGNSVGSNNLVVGNQYTIRAKVHNDANFDANDVKVLFKWVNCGLGQPDRVWEDIGTDGLNIPNNSVREAEIEWAPPSTGHLCVKVEIYHIEDINESNNKGQENLHVGPTSSPTEVGFNIWNPTEEPAYVFLELRQLVPEGEERVNHLWGTWITHPVPQLIEPNGMTMGWVIIDPDYADIKEGEAEFVLTGYINGEIIGGVNFIIQKKGGMIDVFGPCWCCVIVIILLSIIVAILFMILRNLRSRKYFPKGENRP